MLFRRMRARIVCVLNRIAKAFQRGLGVSYDAGPVMRRTRAAAL